MATATLNPNTYTGDSNIYFTTSSSIGVQDSQVQELANSLLQLGFAGWDILISDAGLTMNDLGFVAYNN